MGGTPSDVSTGTVATATWANTIRDQTVQPFASTSARDSAITGPIEGQLAVITGDNIATIYSGSDWEDLVAFGAWRTYTPTLAVWTLGNGTASGYYTRSGAKVTFAVRIILGSTSSTTAGSPTVSLPVTASSAGSVQLTRGTGVTVSLYDATGSVYQGCVVASTTTAVTIGYWQVSGSTIIRNTIGTSTPFASWTTSDEIVLVGTYEAA